jgi:hypothetical protein
VVHDIVLYIVFHIVVHSSSKDDLFNTYCVVITIGGVDIMGQSIILYDQDLHGTFIFLSEAFL